MPETLIGRRRALQLTGFAAAGAASGLGTAVLSAKPAAAAPVSFNPITPYRSVDSRAFGPSGKLASGFFVDWDLWTGINNEPKIPQTAAAVTYNLTATDTENFGWLIITPARQITDVSSINWTATGATLANGGSVQLGVSPETGQGSISLACGGPSARTHYIIDITGYYT